MKLLTLNTHSWLEEHQIPKIFSLARQIVARGVDVVCLQEVNQYQHSPAVYDPEGYTGAATRPVREDNYAWLLVRALRALGWEAPQWAWAEAHEGFGLYDEGVAIISRHPVEQVEVLPHHTPGTEPYAYSDVRRRVSLAARINGRWVVTTHLSWWPQARTEWEALQPQLENLGGGEAMILAGDINNPAHLRGEGYDLMITSGWVDSFHTAGTVLGEATVHKKIHGWEDNEEALRIDVVLCTPDLQPTHHEVVFADNTADALSDHSALIVEIP
ncbi:endonuclease/exonuclease/phosphatase family protein [Corynebacterium sp. 13CS0277]|uniref:endonuclease/exonuclease/phosphatase family protein n=1 Tax=Corynebacterium sp. 13CS0277 TaxID=2071994 RepID=UPI001304DC46|nr:endonuclease/exonuclease/phosphatase family protein [Corynebacterium sp. 13CS0277]